MIDKLLQYISHFDSHHRFIIASLVAGITYFYIPENFNIPAQITTVYVAFAITVLILAWTSMLVCHPAIYRNCHAFRIRVGSSCWYLLW
ncbi:hypothetical protein [Spirosoma telluris]|uniref:hypothetical protein n=1 Tax=Spirosoma telluris TaxID=2183553 RepID=UPI002FC2807B